MNHVDINQQALADIYKELKKVGPALCGWGSKYEESHIVDYSSIPEKKKDGTTS